MNNSKKPIMDQIASLLESQRVAVLSTQKDSQPYASLVAFSASGTLERLYFLTPINTRKYNYLISSPKVAVLVNDSRNRADDIYTAVSVTGTGIASVVEKNEEREALQAFLKKHPQLEDFSNDPATALICIAMKEYVLVNEFQNVVAITMPS